MNVSGCCGGGSLMLGVTRGGARVRGDGGKILIEAAGGCSSHWCDYTCGVKHKRVRGKGGHWIKGAQSKQTVKPQKVTFKQSYTSGTCRSVQLKRARVKI